VQQLTLRGGPELVASGAQLGSVTEVVAAVALAGRERYFGAGRRARRQSRQRRAAAPVAADRPGGVRRRFALAVVAFSLAFPGKLAGDGPSQTLVALAAAVGCIVVVPGC